MRQYPDCVFDVGNAADKPESSRFFLGETVLHKGDGQMYTVCSLSHYEEDYYFLWPLGMICAIPTHGSYGGRLESISEVVEVKQLAG